MPVATRWQPRLMTTKGQPAKAGDFGFKINEMTGAGEGIRTLDPNLGKVVLYP